MKTINGVQYFEDSDLYMCKYATVGADHDGFTVPACSLSGLNCEEVLRNGDEGCNYTPESHENPPLWWDEEDK